MDDKKYPYIPYSRDFVAEEDLIKKSKNFYNFMGTRRSVRDFSDAPVPQEVIENVIKTASTAPSGAHMQPWTFCAISSKTLKAKIREAAEKEEYESYNSRMSEEWLEDLAPLGTDWNKPFLDTVPWIIVVFKKSYGIKPDGSKKKYYYVNESVGLACGFLISAIHNAGLVTLTHTPSPMNFLSEILNRPENEKPFLLLPIGYPSADAQVPDISRKNLEEVCVFYD